MTRPSEQPLVFHVLTGKIKAETGKALLIECTGVDGNDWNPDVTCSHWIPYSQITKITKNTPESGLPDAVHARRWLLQQKGIV